MTRLIQLCVILVAILWCDQALSSPIFESINIERKLNIGFRPMKFGPITFIKEKWGPFGKFIKKHTIERRDLDEINTIDTKDDVIKPMVAEDRIIPVFEKEEPIMGPVPEYRAPVQSFIVVNDPPPVSKLNTDISEAIPVKADPVPVEPIQATPLFTPAKGPETPLFSPAKSPETPLLTAVRNPEINHLESLGAVPIVGSPPIEGPLLVPATPAAPVVTIPVVLASPPPPPLPAVEVPAPPGSRFGAFARFFGEILSEIVNRLIARARLSFGQFRNEPVAAQ